MKAAVVAAALLTPLHRLLLRLLLLLLLVLLLVQVQPHHLWTAAVQNLSFQALKLLCHGTSQPLPRFSARSTPSFRPLPSRSSLGAQRRALVCQGSASALSSPRTSLSLRFKTCGARSWRTEPSKKSDGKARGGTTLPETTTTTACRATVVSGLMNEEEEEVVVVVVVVDAALLVEEVVRVALVMLILTSQVVVVSLPLTLQAQGGGLSCPARRE